MKHANCGEWDLHWNENDGEKGMVTATQERQAMQTTISLTLYVISVRFCGAELVVILTIRFTLSQDL